MNLYNKGIKIFSGNSNVQLANEIVLQIGLPLGSAKVGKFSDGESLINIKETVRGVDVFIIQSTSAPANDNLMELLIMIDACSRASAGRITAVIPYFGYARQDRKSRSRDPISSKLVSNLIVEAGADRVLTMDLHASQIQGFFDIPVDHITGGPILSKYFKNKFEDVSDIVVVAPDMGAIRRARKFAQDLNVPMAIVDKRRENPNESEVMNIVGEVKNKKVILVDDVIDTGGTINNAVKKLLELGAIETYVACTHPVLSGSAIETIQKSEIKELVFLNTIQLPECKKIDKITQLSVSTIFKEAITRINENISISPLFSY